MKLDEAMSMMLFVQDLHARDFSKKKRKHLAKSGAAMPDGSFPIVNRHDLTNAEHMIGLSKHPGAARAHVRERAKALGVKMGKAHASHKARIRADYQNPVGQTDMGDAKSLQPL